jgi:hypothetical protein
MRSAEDFLSLTARLDARFQLLQNRMERSKERSLLELARVLDEERVSYALIGGVAVQFRSKDPRTTLDIDLAVGRYEDIPAAALERAGFQRTGRFAHSENWSGPDGTPIQFTDDPLLAAAIATAETHRLGTSNVKIATSLALIRARLRAAADPARRRSKRLQDLADACGLAEDHPDVLATLTDEERARLAAEG